MAFAIRVPDASITKEFKSFIRKIKSTTSKMFRVLRTTHPMALVPIITLPTAVVKECKQSDNCNVSSRMSRKKKAVAFNTPPVIGSMYGVIGHLKLAGNNLPK